MSLLRIQVLLSCMHQKDATIVQRANLQQVPAVVINQCNVAQEKITYPTTHLTWIDTPTRGLSVSRNLAIRNATADVCVIADDDEVFEKNLVQIIQQGYTLCPQADVLIFSNPARQKNISKVPRKLSKYDLLKVASRQITFKLSKIQDKISFDTCLGAGTGNGGGEENKFLLDCYKAGLHIYFVPFTLSAHIKLPSTWFFGYDANYFYNRGKSMRYILGFWLSSLYGLYFLVAKYPVYKKTISPWQAAKNLFNGIWKNELVKNLKMK